jgi:hypothetical protein
MADNSYSPRSALFEAFPKMKALSKKADDDMERAENILLERELCGLDTSWTRNIALRSGMAHQVHT